MTNVITLEIRAGTVIIYFNPDIITSHTYVHNPGSQKIFLPIKIKAPPRVYIPEANYKPIDHKHGCVRRAPAYFTPNFLSRAACNPARLMCVTRQRPRKFTRPRSAASRCVPEPQIIDRIDFPARKARLAISLC